MRLLRENVPRRTDCEGEVVEISVALEDGSRCTSCSFVCLDENYPLPRRAMSCLLYMRQGSETDKERI